MTRRRAKPAPSIPLEPPWTADHVARLGAVSDRTLAAELRISPHRVQAERVRRGIGPARAGRRARGEVAMSVRRSVPLTEEEAALHDLARGDQPWADWIREAARRAIDQDAAATPDGVTSG